MYFFPPTVVSQQYQMRNADNKIFIQTIYIKLTVLTNINLPSPWAIAYLLPTTTYISKVL